MASKIVTANTAVQEVAADVKNAVHKVKSITIDNNGGSAAYEIIVRDTFTPDSSNGHASPTATYSDRWKTHVLMGEVLTYDEKDLAGVRALGSLGIIADGIDASCYISVGYEDE